MKITIDMCCNEWLGWKQLSEQKLRNSEVLLRVHTCILNKLYTVQYYNLINIVRYLYIFLWAVVWLLIPAVFQADSDFYVLAELLKDYIGLIQAVKVSD